MSVFIKDETRVAIDGVFIDAVNGEAGVDWPIGTPEHPVDNIPDAMTIAAARGTNILRLVNPVDQFTLNADLEGYVVFGHRISRLMGYINPNSHSVSGSVFYDCVINGDFSANDFVDTAFYRCQINSLVDGGVGNVMVHFYDCLLYDIGFSSDGDAFFYNCYADETTWALLTSFLGMVINLVNFKGYLVVRNIQNGTQNFHFGNGWLEIDTGNTGGTLNLYGNVGRWGNGSGVTIRDHTNRPQEENDVNITAIVASETNFMNLTGGGLHFTVDDVVLKCVDPNPNNVNVRLYKLVNGVLTNIKTHTVTMVNFATYFNLMDMFNASQLAGDNIKITVQATGGGPYAVTGNYSYRSA